MGSITGSNFCRRENGRRRNLWSAGDQSPLCTSPESQTVDSSVEYDSFIQSPFSNSYASGDFGCDQRSVNRKHWKRFENGCLNVSLKEGIFSEMTPRSVIENSEHDQFSENRGGYTNGFAGMRSTTPSPQRSQSHINVDNVKNFTTPRKLIYSLQDPNSRNSEVSEKQSKSFRSPCASKFESNPASKYDQNGFSHHPASKYDQSIILCNVNHDNENNENLSLDDEEVNDISESVSSSEYVPVLADVQVSQKLVPGSKTKSLTINVQKDYPRSALSMLCGLFIVLFAAFLCLLWIGGDQDECYNLLPT